MKKIISLLLIIAASFIFVSCEEDFSPKAPLENGYALVCIIKMKNSETGIIGSVEAIVRKVYNVDGFQPVKPDSSTFVRNVKLTFYKGASAYPMTDSGKTVINNKLKTFPLDKFVPVIAPSFSGNEACRIVAVLPDGKTLSADAVMLRDKRVEMSRTFNHGLTGKVNEFYWGKTLTISWGDPYNSGHVFFPKLVINYTMDSVNYSKEVPLTYVSRNGKKTAVMPGPVYVPEVEYDYASLDSAMTGIGAGIAVKKKITVISCTLSVSEFDRNLSSYYASTNGYMDSYSIRLDENIFSNVNGGYGLFGIVLTTRNFFAVDRDYIRSFGYSVESDGIL
ncbi:MAG: hypothetical protein ACM3Q2_16180 [Syntrophothermus sp.]